jgi:hypothetical protein
MLVQIALGETQHMPSPRVLRLVMDRLPQERQYRSIIPGCRRCIGAGDDFCSVRPKLEARTW